MNNMRCPAKGRVLIFERPQDSVVIIVVVGTIEGTAHQIVSCSMSLDLRYSQRARWSHRIRSFQLGVTNVLDELQSVCSELVREDCNGLAFAAVIYSKQMYLQETC